MNQLFRPEALQNRTDRLHGEVTLALPVSWQLIGGFLFVGVAIASLFLALGSYAQVEAVEGVLVPDRGIASIVPTRPGTVTMVHVAEGKRVRAGQSLFSIRAEESMGAGGSAQDRVTAAIAQQDASLAGQSVQLAAAAAAERARIAAEIRGVTAELVSLRNQIRLQAQLVSSAKAEFENIQKVAGRGFISRRDVQQREEAYLTRLQNLSQLEQARDTKLSDLDEARQSQARIDAEASAQTSSIQSSRSELAQRLTGAEASQAYRLVAPVDGVVTSVTGRIGQAVRPDQPLAAVVPAGSELLAQLYVPTRAAGFLEKGQEVRLAVEAFPFQRYGAVQARITEIASVPVSREVGEGRLESVYLVTARIQRASLSAFWSRQRLVPGMTLSARIVTREHSLLEWLFEPLLSIRNR